MRHRRNTGCACPMCVTESDKRTYRVSCQKCSNARRHVGGNYAYCIVLGCPITLQSKLTCRFGVMKFRYKRHSRQEKIKDELGND